MHTNFPFEHESGLKLIVDIFRLWLYIFRHAQSFEILIICPSIWTGSVIGSYLAMSQVLSPVHSPWLGYLTLPLGSLQDIHLVTAISLPPNNCFLVSMSLNKSASLWNLDANLPVGPPLYHEQRLYAVLSPDGKVLVTACQNKNV